MYTLSEVLMATMALSLAPLFVWTLRRLELRDKGFIGLAILATFASIAFTIAEGYVLPELFNTLEHALGPVVAISLALFATRFMRRTWSRAGSR
ncbi:MAG: hypothetical protein ACYC6C_09075 [Coriobacteriia bacterium]